MFDDTKLTATWDLNPPAGSIFPVVIGCHDGAQHQWFLDVPMAEKI